MYLIRNEKEWNNLLKTEPFDINTVHPSAYPCLVIPMEDSLSTPVFIYTDSAADLLEGLIYSQDNLIEYDKMSYKPMSPLVPLLREALRSNNGRALRS